MSVIIGMNVGRYVIFGTDTRQVFYDRELKMIQGARDGYDKLVAGPTGLMTGSGYTALLEAAMARMPRATSIQELLDIIADERRSVEADPRWQAAQKENILGQTGWMLTYRGVDGTVRFAMYHPSRGHAFHAFGAGAGVPWFPDCPGEEDIREQVQQDLTARLEAGLRVCEPDEPLGPSVAYHIELLQSVLAEAAARIPTTISAECLIGVHTDAGEIFVESHQPDAVAPMALAA